MTRTAVVAYSGGLDTSCILAWLKEDWYGFDEVVLVLVDVGQEFDLEESITRAKAADADDVLLVDRKDAFADEQCARAILTNALYEGKYPLVSALSRPVIAQAVAEIALEIGAEAVVHGCTGKGNDQLRFELAFKAHYPGVKVIAPLRDRIWTRDEEIEYAIARGIPVVQTAASPSRSTRTSSAARSRPAFSRILGTRRRRSHARSRPTRRCSAPIEIVVGFERGLPVSLDGEELSLADLIAQVNRLAGAYGIGRIDMIENRAVGIKSREVYEAPGAMTLIAAHSALEDVVLTKDEARIKRRSSSAGRRSSTKAAGSAGTGGDRRVRRLDAGLVTGEVRVELRPNAAVVTGGRSPRMIYAAELASYGAGETFHDAAEGFIRISSLETELHAAKARAAGGACRPRDERLAGRVEGALDPEVWRFLRVDDVQLLPYDCEATAEHARRLAAAGLADRCGAGRGRVAPRRDRAGPRRVPRLGRGRALGDRAPARRRRAEDPRGSLTERSRSRRRSALRARRVRRGARGDRRARARRSLVRRVGGRDGDARVHTSNVRSP